MSIFPVVTQFDDAIFICYFVLCLFTQKSYPEACACCCVITCIIRNSSQLLQQGNTNPYLLYALSNWINNALLFIINMIFIFIWLSASLLISITFYLSIFLSIWTYLLYIYLSLFHLLPCFLYTFILVCYILNKETHSKTNVWLLQIIFTYALL